MDSKRTLVTLLDKVLYDDFLSLMILNKQQIFMAKSQTSTRKLRISHLLSGCGFVQRIAQPSRPRKMRQSISSALERLAQLVKYRWLVQEKLQGPGSIPYI